MNRFALSVLATSAAFIAPARAQILINEINTGLSDYIEIINIGSASVDISGWKVRSYETRGNTAGCTPPSGSFGLQDQIVVPAGTMLGAGAILAFDEGGSFGNQPSPNIMETGSNIFFNEDTDAEVWIEDATGTVIDYVIFGDVVIDEFVNSPHVPAGFWVDSPILRPRDKLDLMVRVMPFDTNTAFEWELVSDSNATLGTANAMVTGPLKGYGLGWSASGNCDSFSNGNWATRFPTLTLENTATNTLAPGGQFEFSVSTGMSMPPLGDLLALSSMPFDLPVPLAGCPVDARVLLLPPAVTVSGLGLSYDANGAATSAVVPLANDPTLSGAIFYLQAFFLDGGQGGCIIRSTNGMELRFQ